MPRCIVKNTMKDRRTRCVGAHIGRAAGGYDFAIDPFTEAQQCRWHALPDRPALDRAAAARILASACRALRARGQFHLVLAGGDTPAGAYRTLRNADANW